MTLESSAQQAFGVQLPHLLKTLGWLAVIDRSGRTASDGMLRHENESTQWARRRAERLNYA
jgi:hypothetical protein